MELSLVNSHRRDSFPADDNINERQPLNGEQQERGGAPAAQVIGGTERTLAILGPANGRRDLNHSKALARKHSGAPSDPNKPMRRCCRPVRLGFWWASVIAGFVASGLGVVTTWQGAIVLGAVRLPAPLLSGIDFLSIAFSTIESGALAAFRHINQRIGFHDDDHAC